MIWKRFLESLHVLHLHEHTNPWRSVLDVRVQAFSSIIMSCVCVILNNQLMNNKLLKQQDPIPDQHNSTGLVKLTETPETRFPSNPKQLCKALMRIWIKHKRNEEKKAKALSNIPSSTTLGGTPMLTKRAGDTRALSHPSSTQTLTLWQVHLLSFMKSSTSLF